MKKSPNNKNRNWKDKLITTSIFAVLISGWSGSIFADEAKVNNSHWSQGEKESYSEFSCPTDNFMVGRAHSGDENGNTSYKCGNLVQNGGTITSKNKQWSSSIKESDGTADRCPQEKVMIGRKHTGDENGTTSYECGTPINKNGEILSIIIGNWSDAVKESSSKFECPDNSVMIGRRHAGDENGRTEYLCGKLAN